MICEVRTVYPRVGRRSSTSEWWRNKNGALNENKSMWEFCQQIKQIIMVRKAMMRERDSNSMGWLLRIPHKIVGEPMRSSVAMSISEIRQCSKQANILNTYGKLGFILDFIRSIKVFTVATGTRVKC
jgi:hypothetical protein